MNNANIEFLRKTAPKPHIPSKLPLDSYSFLTRDVVSLLSKANNAIGRYSGFLTNIPNPWLLLSPITTQEAVLSSKLEGTHATLEDILNHEAGNQTPITEDELNEILNYRKALFYAIDNVSPISELSKPTGKFPFTTKIIKEMHKILLSNVRGSSKHPGEFKISQNYIGSTTQISFTPLPPTMVTDYMSDLEKYINYEDVDFLLQSAIIHAQFEMIHPFEDGNGRIGRLLIPLFLFYTGLIPLPTFYMSSFFEKDRNVYIQKLADISSKNDWISWLCYFLNGINVQAELNIQKATKILNLYESFKNMEIKSYYFINILDFIFQHPIFTAKQIMATEEIKANKQTIYNVLQKMVKAGILTSSDRNRNTTYMCNKLLYVIEVN